MNSMKRVIFTAVAIGLIAVCFIWIIVSNGNEKAKEGNKMASDEVRFDEQEIKSLDLKLGACEVEIREGNGFCLEYEDLAEGKLHYSVKDGTLNAKYDGNTTVGFNFFGISVSGKKRNPRIKLTIPKDVVFEKVTMEYGASEVSMDKVMAAELKLTVGAGELNAAGLTATEKAEIKVGAGEINLKDADLANAKMECGVGELNLEGKISGDNNLKCGVGSADLTITGCTQEDFYGDLKCGLGELELGDIRISGSGKKSYGTDAANRLDVECGVGGVFIRFNK